MDTGLVARLRRQLATGDLVLFTGAGFSRNALARDGLPIASVYDLRLELHRLAFPSAAGLDDDSSLGDLFEVAVARARNAVRDVLTRRLTVDPKSLPDRYRAWFSLPWFRHYTLNMDDLDEAVASHFSLPRQLRAISGQRDGVPSIPALLSVHLNGRLSDFPEVTFSARQYAQRASRPEIWYQTLVTDLLNHPVIFVGTVLDEPSLWQYIELRRLRGTDTIEMRPPSYLVTPRLPQARAALLKRYNINWIQSTEDEFFDEAFSGAAAEAESGRTELARRFNPTPSRVSVRSLADLRTAPPSGDPTLFLLGKEPEWADLLTGFAIVRSFEPDLLTNAASGDYAAIVISGTSASGKSTTAMRLALGLEGMGRRVFVLDALQSELGVGTVVSAVRTMNAEVVLVDDLDIFGERASRLIKELSEVDRAPLVIGAIRSSRLQALDLSVDFKNMRVLEQTVPDLHNADIDRLLSALERANRLGQLSGMDVPKRRQVLREQCGRQLLVGTYRATSGEMLQQKVYSECADLNGDARSAYGMAAIATSERYYILRDEITVGLGLLSGVIDNTKLNVVQDLVQRGLLLMANGRELRLRHRWIAETALEFFIDNGIMSAPLKALIFALAGKVDPQLIPRSRERQLLRRLLNHDYLQRRTMDLGAVREIYALVEDQLAWDYHYWLQRGSLEVETGDLALAENFLNSALSLSPSTDYRVTTEYAYMLLKKAANNPTAPSALSWADTALRDLEAAMASRGKDDPYPFHVYGSQGLSWSRRAPLPQSDKIILVRQLRDAVSHGRNLHPRRTDLRQLAEDLQHEYLLLAT